MSKSEQSELRQKEMIVQRLLRNGEVKSVVFPNGLQAGLSKDGFNSGIKIVGTVNEPSDTSERLYVVDGALHYDGSALNTGGTLTVEDERGTPSASSVTTIKVTAGTLTDDGSGVVTLSTGAGAPDDAQYLVLSANGSLSDERVLALGAGLGYVDGGAGNSYTLSLDLTEVIASDAANRLLRSDGDGTLTAITTFTLASDEDSILGNQVLGG